MKINLESKSSVLSIAKGLINQATTIFNVGVRFIEPKTVIGVVNEKEKKKNQRLSSQDKSIEGGEKTL